jgi:type I restriction enzyme M protein
MTSEWTPNPMNQSSLVQKVWNYATVLRNEGVHYGAYISQISFLLFLKMDDEAASQLGEPSGLPVDCRWGAIKDLQGEALATRYSAILDKLSRHDGLIGGIFMKAQNEIQDPAKLRRLVTMIGEETWLGLDLDTKGTIYEGLLGRAGIARSLWTIGSAPGRGGRCSASREPTWNECPGANV